MFPRQLPETVEKNYRDALNNGAFVNFYMFCGGTNFGFFNGALHAVYRADVPGAKDRYVPFLTSYDVDAWSPKPVTPRKSICAAAKSWQITGA